MNLSAAQGLCEIIKTNLGPKGTLKMLVGGGGDIKLSKDGHTLLSEMFVQNPTALMIARAAIAQHAVIGDGNTSVVVLIADLLKQAERYLVEGVHPHMIRAGWRASEIAIIELLNTFRRPIDVQNRETLKSLVRTSLETKLEKEVANPITAVVLDAVLAIRKDGEESIDPQMIEIIQMRHKFSSDTQLIRGLVFDHGLRHPDMPKHVEQCFILSCNISLEYEKSEINSTFFYKNISQKEKMFEAERKLTNLNVKAILELKREVCHNSEKSFMVINQKGIDSVSLDMFAKEGVLALRRAKKRNAERLKLFFGGYCINSIEELSSDCLGFAGMVHEETLDDEKYTFVEDAECQHAVSILVRGPTDYAMNRITSAVNNCLRSVKNALFEKNVIYGAGAFEMAGFLHLTNNTRKLINGKPKLGAAAFGQALLSIPKSLAYNAGFDIQEVVINIQHEHERGAIAGLDIHTGKPLDMSLSDVYDDYSVKKQILTSASIVASQLLLVDEIIQLKTN
jgi:T-complex protein 1 subunit zeta